MKNMLKFLIAFLAIQTIIVACSTVPLTNRKQLNMIPDNELLAMSYQQYDAFLNENKVSQNQEQTRLVKGVGLNIKTAVTRYLADNNYADLLEGYAWEFNLVENDLVNAWCMPGGKVVIYTGILPITQDETGLAVVMGHEIAHAIAEHGGERMSQEMLRQFGGFALSMAVQKYPEQTQQYWMAAYGLGSEVGIMLPYSRTHETEADHMGLIFMAMAGYDPQEAPEFWKRMATAGGQSPPEFLSTHPSSQTRISNLNSWMPEAMGYYEKSK